MKRITLSFIGAAALTIAAVAPAAAQDSITVDMREVDGSGQTGSVDITSVEGEDQVTVAIEIEPGEEGVPQPAHIHDGSCDDLGDVAFPLEDVEEGASESTVDVSMTELLRGEYAINVHQSEDAMDVNVSCGNLPLIGAPADEGDEEGEESEEGAEEEENGESASEDEDADSTEEEGDDSAAGTNDDASADDAETTEEDEATGELAPETGDSGMVDAQTAVLFMTVLAGGALGAGLLVRRRAHQA